MLTQLKSEDLESNDSSFISHKAKLRVNSNVGAVSEKIGEEERSGVETE